MRRYWVIAPYDSKKPDIFETAWSYDLAHRTIAVGWKELVDIGRLSKDEITLRYRETYPHITNKGSITRDVNTLWNFLHEISIGDVIIARKGTKKTLGHGIVTGIPIYDVAAGKERVGNLTEDYYPYLIPVDWEISEITYPNIVFSFYTMYEIAEDKYKELIREVIPLEQKDEGSLVEQSAEFVLEKYLEDFIVTNFDTIFNGQLILYKDQDGGVGQQFPIVNSDGRQIGRIDILAKDTDSDNYMVIELKKGRESDQVVGQLLRYMGWVKENLCEATQEVKGLIICREIDERLAYAVAPITSIVQIKRYKVDFQLINT